MIGIEVQPRTPWMTSVPSMSGSPRSRMITSGRSRATAASPVVPSTAVLTSYSRALRLIRSARRGTPARRVRGGDPPAHGLGEALGHREPEPHATRVAVADPGERLEDAL